MAEVAIPIAALGVMYILSNKNKDKTVETFETSRRPNKNMKLPNTDNPVVNFPVETYSELKTNPSRYEKPNNLKQRYYNPEIHLQQAEEDNKEERDTFVSLTGIEMDKNKLKHGNMQPFFSSTVKQGGIGDKHEGLLDSMTGCGSQQIRKEARAPLFAPQANLSYINGADQGDFMRERINKPMRVANVNPFKETKVDLD